MEVQVRERLVGALVLVAIVVLFVPALLKGPARERATADTISQQSIEIPVRGTNEPAREEMLVPEAPSPPQTAVPIVEEPLPRAEAPPAIAARLEPAPVPAPKAAEPDSVVVASGQPAWAVQLGAFSTREKAESLAADLRKRGYAAFVLEHRANGKVLHRVRVGPEQDRARAAAIAERLRKDGFQPVVAPHP
jgi:DedD protein